MSIGALPVAQLAVSEQAPVARRRKPPPNRVIIPLADVAATPEPR